MRFSASTLQQSLHHDLSAHIDVDLPSWSIDDSSTAVACYRLKESLLKKFNMMDRPSEAACSAALGKFKEVNTRMSKWGLELNTVQPDWELFSMLKAELKEFLDPSNEGPIYSDYQLMFELGYSGPGASIGALGCDFYTKMFASRLTSTDSLSDVWSTLIRYNPQFRLAYSETALKDQSIKVVDHNKLSFVNKNHDIARTICVEPTINMWLQLGMGNILKKRLLRKYGIDFRVQPEVNRCMARLGSLKDHLVTIDLESASDSLGLRMMDEVFPQKFMGMLRRLRSPKSRLPDGSLVQLEMVSTMGNGFTFPLQTLLFAASCVVVHRYLGIPCVSTGAYEMRSMSVFGDDIIVDKRASRLLIHLLEMLGFVVNANKTFVEGPFRESCGIDWFLGQDVRPVYLKSLRSLQDAFVAINRLNLWSAKTGVSLRNTVSYVLEVFPRARNCLVPLDEDDSSGIKVPRELSSPLSRVVKNSFGLLRYVASVPAFVGYKIDTDACRLLGHPRNAVYNPRGLYLAFLGGYVTGYRSERKGRGLTLPKVSIRQMATRYVTKRKCTPNWGHLRPEVLSGYPDRIERLTNAIRKNL
jgi:hypothetical protein